MDFYNRLEKYILAPSLKEAKILFAIILSITLGGTLLISPLYTVPAILVLISIFAILINPFTGLIIYVLSFLIPTGYNVGFIIFGITALSWVARLLSKQNSRKNLIRSPLNWIVVGLYVAALIPAIFVDGVLENYLENPKEPLLILGYTLSAIIIMNMIDSIKKINSIIWAMVAVGVTLGLISAVQFFSGTYIGTSYEYLTMNTMIVDQIFGDIRRATSVFGDAPTTGYFLQTFFFLFLGKIFEEETRFKKLFFLISSLLLAFGIFATLSRAVWLSSTIVFIYWRIKKGITFKELLITPLVISVIFFAFQETIEQRIYQTFVGGDYKQDEIYEQKAEIKRFIDSPFLGTGLGSKNEFEVLRPYLEEEGLFYYVDYDEDKEVSRLNLYTQEEQFTTTSFYTGIAVQLGIYGLILLLFVIVYTWFALTKAEKISKSIKNNWLYNLTLGLKASFLGQIIYLARGNPTFKLFWLMVGVSLALSFLLKTKYNSEILNLLKIKTE